MQSFIVNIPDEQLSFFKELMSRLDLEIIDLESIQDDATQSAGKMYSDSLKDKQNDDPFLDWEEELKNAKR